MSDSAVVDDDISESPEDSYRMFRTVTELVMHLDSLPESQFYLYGAHEDMTQFILRGDDGNSSVSVDNLFHVFQRLPELETLVVTGMPLDNIVTALNRLRDDSEEPVLRRLRYLYTRGIGESSLPLTRFLGQRLEPELPVPQIVCPASLKNAVGTRFPKPFSVPEPMQKFLKMNLETSQMDWILKRRSWN
ncbi:hypothetical protein BC826DRAFT_1001325 [Russula brevipes]|nr:hypothetical protein BC826DRAFT_1001325 [Russula brevipes]